MRLQSRLKLFSCRPFLLTWRGMEALFQASDTQSWAPTVLFTTILVAVSVLLWQRDFFGGIYRFFILFKVSKLSLFFSDPVSHL